MKALPFCFVRPLLALLILAGLAAGADPASILWRVTGIAPGDVLNVRTGPGMEFPIATKLENGAGGIHVTGDKVMNGKDDWLPVSFPGGKGWTRPKYLTRTDSPAVSADSKQTADTYSVTGVPAGDKLNVRSGPGTEYPVVARLGNGENGLQVVDESQVLLAAMMMAAGEGGVVPYQLRNGGRVFNGEVEWVAIKFGGKEGWVRREYLRSNRSVSDEGTGAGGAAVSNASSEDEDPSPEGCYWLARTDAESLDSSSLEICLKSRNVRAKEGESISTGDFTITILDGKKELETYHMNCLLTDGSGSHVDFLFAASTGVLRKIGNTDAYARGNSEPPADVIYYILLDPEIKGGKPLKSGDRAGSVTIHGVKRSLFIK